MTGLGFTLAQVSAGDAELLTLLAPCHVFLDLALAYTPVTIGSLGTSCSAEKLELPIPPPMQPPHAQTWRGHAERNFLGMAP